MSTVISPATGKLVKVGSKEFQDLMNNPRYRDYFTYPKLSDLNARVTPIVPYVPPSTALPVVPAYGSLNSYSSGSPNVSSNLSLSLDDRTLPSVSYNFPQETNSESTSEEMTRKFGTNNRSAPTSSPTSDSNQSVSKNFENLSLPRSIPNSLIIPPQYPAEKVNLASLSVPIQQVWPSLSKTGCQNCYYRP